MRPDVPGAAAAILRELRQTPRTNGKRHLFKSELAAVLGIADATILSPGHVHRSPGAIWKRLASIPPDELGVELCLTPAGLHLLRMLYESLRLEALRGPGYYWNPREWPEAASLVLDLFGQGLWEEADREAERAAQPILYEEVHPQEREYVLSFQLLTLYARRLIHRARLGDAATPVAWLRAELKQCRSPLNEAPLLQMGALKVMADYERQRPDGNLRDAEHYLQLALSLHSGRHRGPSEWSPAERRSWADSTCHLAKVLVSPTHFNYNRFEEAKKRLLGTLDILGGREPCPEVFDAWLRTKETLREVLLIQSIVAGRPEPDLDAHWYGFKQVLERRDTQRELARRKWCLLPSKLGFAGPFYLVVSANYDLVIKALEHESAKDYQAPYPCRTQRFEVARRGLLAGRTAIVRRVIARHCPPEW